MWNGVNVQRIGLVGLGVVIAFLVAGVILTLAGHPDQGTNALATATGVVIGVGTSTTVQVIANNNRTSDGTSNEPPKAA